MVTSDVLVIGGGPAGITFSRTLRKLRLETSITMLRPEEHSMVYCAIPYAIEGLFEHERVYKKDSLVTDVGVNLVRTHAVNVNFDDKEVTGSDGTVFRYKTLFLATGAVPVRPSIPGATARNVFTIKTQGDMLALIGRVQARARRVAVIGAGAIGIEQAQAYRQKGLDTHLVDIANHVLPNMIDEDMAMPLHDVLVEKGIHLRLGVGVEKMETVEKQVCQVRLTNGDTIDIDPERDFVCLSVGMKPDVGLFEHPKLAVERDGIVVDARMRTSLPDVYAAGDNCHFHSAIDGKPVGGKLATNAVPMAKVAARNVAGIADEYLGFLNGAATCAFQYRVGATGFTEELARQRGFEVVGGHGSTTSLFPMMPGATKLKVKIVADAQSERVLGGQVLSETPTTDKVDTITLAIQQGLTLEQLARLSYSAQPWQSFFPARNAIVEACEEALGLLAAQA
ncbi:MAG: FAD-dependent oxidoreductase [Phycisphaerae bacterium]|jgi:NADPH-dependent 2,4-dienoyl-CoA reductase/sulfur reductase-like enzyme